MNHLIKAQLVLEEWRKALGTLLDIPAEDRSEDFSQKIETAKANITTAQADLHTAAQAEPEVPGAPAGQPSRCGASGPRWSAANTSEELVRHCACRTGNPMGPNGGTAKALGTPDANQIPAFSDKRLSKSGQSPRHRGRWGRISKGLSPMCFPNPLPRS